MLAPHVGLCPGSPEPPLRRRRAGAGACALLFVVLGVQATFGCRVFEPHNKPIEACRRSCIKKASQQCDEALCERGCEFILDRLVEREGERVIACVASSPRRCTDVVWADCAAKVGVHADGGPPAPPPPEEDE